MNIFASISGQFGRAIIIGALLPAALFVGAAYLFVLPMIPWEWRIVARIEAIQPQWKLAALAVFSIVGAGLLYIFNISIIRLYEGYPWKDGPIGRWRRGRHRDRIAAEAKAATEARPLAGKVGDALASDLDTMRESMERDAMRLYPAADDALPTRLGNVIRSFEQYPDTQYQIEAITLWPRFVAKLQKEHAVALDETKTSFDVMIHLSFLSALLFALFVAVGCLFPSPFASPALLLPFVVRLIVCAALCWFFYTSSIGRAEAWGQLVRAVFDLYRWDVLQAFGCDERPRDLETERAVWYEISQQMIYGDPKVGPLAVRYDPRTVIYPLGYGLHATRSIRKVDELTRTIVVHVANPRDEDLDATVIETLPTGSELIVGSANVAVSGTNPYRFAAGVVKAKQSGMITYRVLMRKA